jgi:hypothetical protein
VEESSRRRFARNVHVKNWNFLFYCSNIAKSENAMLWRMLPRLETCIVYSCIWSVTLTKSMVPRKTWRKLWHSYISKLFLTKMQVKFSIFFHHRSLNENQILGHYLKLGFHGNLVYSGFNIHRFPYRISNTLYW